MTANQAIQKIRVLLGVEEEIVVAPAAMASATLIDGTEVSVEGEFEVGKPLFVVTPEGNIPAPAGIHQTTENLLVTVDEAGIITQIEPITEEATEEVTEEEKVEMSENKEEEKMEEATIELPVTEDLVKQIVEGLSPMFEEIKELKEKVVEMESKFQKFSKEPAAKPIKKAEAFETARFSAVERLSSIRKSK